MADYCATVRSNYFKVKDPLLFDTFCERWGLEKLSKSSGTLVGFTPDPMSSCHGTIEGPPEEDCPDFAHELSQQLEDGEVAIWMEAGNEKLRYVHGTACAVNSKGKLKTVSLYDIYKKAEKLTDRPKDISACEY